MSLVQLATTHGDSEKSPAAIPGIIGIGIGVAFVGILFVFLLVVKLIYQFKSTRRAEENPGPSQT